MLYMVIVAEGLIVCRFSFLMLHAGTSERRWWENELGFFMLIYNELR